MVCVPVFNVAHTAWDYRWMESDLLSSSNGVDFENEGRILFDPVLVNNHPSDYLDIEINKWVTHLKYDTFVITPATYYYGMGEVEIYGDTNPPSSIPEPISIILFILSLMGIYIHKHKLN